MNLFLVRRPSAWADLSALKSSCVASNDAEGRDPNRRIRWIRSYVVNEADGRFGSFCVYEAPHALAIFDHAREMGIPDLRPIQSRA